MTRRRIQAALAGLALLAVACNGGPDGRDGASGSIEVDGSSTVFPLTEAVAEEYAFEQPDVTVNISRSGTGGGFERFCDAGDIDISNASRPILDEEAERCRENGVDFVEVRVGTDALTMVTHPETGFVDCLTRDEVQAIWAAPGADTWAEVRDGFPDDEVRIFAPDADSGTYDFFNEVVLDEGQEPIGDYNASADDNVIVTGVSGTPSSWGYFGFAFLQENPGRLQAIAYDGGDGCVEPSAETARDDTYGLARPLFIYVKESSLARSHVADFVRFYLDVADELIAEIGYIPAPDDALEESRQRVEDAVEGE